MKCLSEYVSAIALLSVSLLLTQSFVLSIDNLTNKFSKIISSSSSLTDGVYVERISPYKYVIVDSGILETFYTNGEYLLINSSSLVVIRVEDHVTVTLVLKEGVVVV
ncbi:MAG: hypothetical protein QXO78_02390 [Desulfurococcaceae archaeon]|uniref:Uncharacterized protein n=1 Tax=Staphylothermus marinus TaxID=2280 RepID=A0A7C4JM81_STAMA